MPKGTSKFIVNTFLSNFLPEQRNSKGHVCELFEGSGPCTLFNEPFCAKCPLLCAHPSGGRLFTTPETRDRHTQEEEALLCATAARAREFLSASSWVWDFCGSRAQIVIPRAEYTQRGGSLYDLTNSILSWWEFLTRVRGGQKVLLDFDTLMGKLMAFLKRKIEIY